MTRNKILLLCGTLLTMSLQAQTMHNGHEYVDLGLPSGTLWATCNVGANSPMQTGYYFAWGETITKSTFSIDNYKFNTHEHIYPDPYNNGPLFCVSKYCVNNKYGRVDNLTTLSYTDDAARQYWGAKWRMPTTYEIQELFIYCTIEWYNYKGVNGLLFTGKNKKQMFIPAGGWKGEGVTANNEYVYCWSSSLYQSNSTTAHKLGGDKTNLNNSPGHDRCTRYGGLNIRPVCDKSAQPDAVQPRKQSQQTHTKSQTKKKPTLTK